MRPGPDQGSGHQKLWTARQLQIGEAASPVLFPSESGRAAAGPCMQPGRPGPCRCPITHAPHTTNALFASCSTVVAYPDQLLT